MSNKAEKVILPSVIPQSVGLAQSIAKSLGLESHLQVSKQDVLQAWDILPTLIGLLPEKARTETIVHLSSAVSVGAFDAAISYGWNIAMVGLRRKFATVFGERYPKVMLIMIPPKWPQKENDKRFLDHCSRLKLLSDESYEKLNQCRGVRNKSSAAHPVSETPSAVELIGFLTSSWTAVFSTPPGKDAQNAAQILDFLHGDELSPSTLAELCSSINQYTIVGQAMVLRAVHGIVCEQSQSSMVRTNALSLCNLCTWNLTPYVVDGLVRQHLAYQRDRERKANKRTYSKRAAEASSYFLESTICLGGYLPETPEQEALLRVCDNLVRTSADQRAFRYEPLIARQLEGLKDGTVERSNPTRFRYVEAVTTCAVGHERGISLDSWEVYREIIKEFSGPEIEILLSMPHLDNVVGHRLRTVGRCIRQFSTLVNLLDKSHVSQGALAEYRKWASTP